jgi:hypothetical protein
MHCSEFLENLVEELEDQIQRGKAVGGKLTKEQLNWSPAPGKWSIAQIFEHMMIANTPYIPALTEGVQAAEKASPTQVKHTMFGRFLIKSAGPTGNAPAPKQMHPGPGPYDFDIIDRWAGQTQSLLDLAKGAHGVNLCSYRIQNPILKMFKMNLADCFMILEEHTERHVQQIEILQNRCAEPGAMKAAV